jgi:hypothetical protein
MTACKMTAADAREGWTLLEALGTADFERTTKLPSSPKIIEDLGKWQTRWFAIAEATLGRRMPAVAERLFLNLGRAHGIDLLASVQLMVDRLAELRDPAGKCGPDGPRALAALAARGLDQAVIEQAESLLSAMQRPTADPGSATSEEAVARDEEALWRWYLEWAQIARTQIKERCLLRRMGLRMAGGAADEAAQSGPSAAEAAS